MAAVKIPGAEKPMAISKSWFRAGLDALGPHLRSGEAMVILGGRFSIKKHGSFRISYACAMML
jgi:hypothetical protein